MVPRGAVTTDVAHVTCRECVVRLLIELHRQTAILLKTMVGLEKIGAATLVEDKES